MRSKIFKSQEGEKRCRICGDPLPALCFTEARKAFICSKKECQEAFYGHSKRWRWIGPGEIKCEAPGCDQYVPAGWWQTSYRKHFFCCQACVTRFYLRRRKPDSICALPGCGAPIVRPPKKGYKQRFCSKKHAAVYRSQRVTREKAGRFAGRMEEFINNFVRIHYRPRTISSVRSDLLRFFSFLGERRIRSLKRVTPRIITEFTVWEAGIGGGKAYRQSALKYVSVFFAWQIHQGYLKGPNPVIPGIHRAKRERRLPRPYSEPDFETMWRILDKRGDALSRLAVAIGEESGLRISETAKLHLPDVDAKSQKIFVGLPTKTGRERRVPFGEKTRRYLAEWLKERDNSCGHDFLFHNSLGEPMTANTLWKHLRMIFDGYLTKKRETYDEVFDGFKYHRLRHSMASTLANHGMDAVPLMAMGGWRSFDGMKGYIGLKRQTVESAYMEAIEEARRSAKEEPVQEVSLEEFARKKAQESVTS